ncbi:helix-turn-helix domain-containing protein [Microscilla marina]|uniref:HTH cro/C1-type domain-containing protein n=1 Tax=Microscilla marina ATCC 23134 TaxID=313606 RepID=A1ZTB9_MICM2|nr:helix-turn-helix transcriptional regulator [Microscilla marina]EAY26341.1 hypothetical protein M23134_04619 [Microscilla marina ATCC 23134]
MMKKQAKIHKSELIDDLLDSVSPEEETKITRKMQLATKLDEGLKAKGWKKKDLMKAMGQSNASMVTRWLSGTHNFTVDTLIDLERVLDVQLLDIEPPVPSVSFKLTPEIAHNLPPEMINELVNVMQNMMQTLTRKYKIQVNDKPEAKAS